MFNFSDFSETTWTFIKWGAIAIAAIVVIILLAGCTAPASDERLSASEDTKVEDCVKMEVVVSNLNKEASANNIKLTEHIKVHDNTAESYGKIIKSDTLLNDFLAALEAPVAYAENTRYIIAVGNDAGPLVSVMLFDKDQCFLAASTRLEGSIGAIWEDMVAKSQENI